MTKNGIDLKDTIQNDYEIPSSIFDGRYTKTSLFILPTVDINRQSQHVKPYFVNAFLDDKGYEHDFVRPVFVLFRTKSLKDSGWRKLYEAIRTKKEYILDYDLGMQDGYNLIMCVFKCRDEFKEDYYHFKKGRYSQFSPVYKKKFSETIVDENGSFVKSMMYGVINKTDYMKEKIKTIFVMDDEDVNDMQEWWDIPRGKREYYRFNEKNQNGNINKGSTSETQNANVHGS